MVEPLRTETQQASIGEIRKTLRALWASEGLAGDGVMRARTVNLIVYAEGDDATVGATIERVTELTARRPGRIIVIQYDEARTEPVDAWVTLYCLTDGARQVCAEVIVLVVGPDVRREIHSTVISLLGADLPVYLWWLPLPDPADHLFQQLAADAERVVVNTETAADPREALPKASALGGFALADVAWARLTPWRRMIAHLWDAPHLRGPLSAIRQVRVEHTGPRTRALLLVGWLADRLGWTVGQVEAHGSTLRAVFSANEIAGEIELVEVTADLPPGEIVQVAFVAGDGEPYARPRLAVSVGRGCVEVSADAGVAHGTPFEPVTAADALAEALDFRYDATYEGALARATEIVESSSP